MSSLSGLSLSTLTTYYFNVRAVDNLGNLSAIVSGDGWRTVALTTVAAKATAAPNWNDFYRVATPAVLCDGTETLRTDCSHGAEKKIIDLPDIASCNNLKVQDTLDVLYWRCDATSGHAIFESVKLKEGKGLKSLINTSGQWKELQAVVYQSNIPIKATVSAAWWSNTILPLPNNDGTTQLTLDTPDRIYYIAANQATRGYYVIADKLSFVSLNGSALTLSTGTTENCDSLGSPGSDDIRAICTNSRKFNWYEMDINTTTLGAAIMDYNAKRATYFNFQSTRIDTYYLFRSKVSQISSYPGAIHFIFDSSINTHFENISNASNLQLTGNGQGNSLQRISGGSSFYIIDWSGSTSPSKLSSISANNLNMWFSTKATVNNAKILFSFNFYALSNLTISNALTAFLNSSSTLTKLTGLWLTQPSPGSVCSSIGDTGFNNSCAIGGLSDATKVLNVDPALINNKTGDGVTDNGAFTPGFICPAAAHGNKVATNQETAPLTYLLNAYEILEDEIGNDDGLCTSNEACIYTPNFGANQGTGDFYSNGTCAFQNGTVTGVKLYAYPNP